MTYFMMFLAMCFSAVVQAKTYKTSSNQVDVCKGHTSQSDITYQPADDVNLNSFDFGLNKKIIKIPLEYDAIQALGISAPWQDNIDAKADLGMLEIHPDGRMTFAGQEITASSLQAICEQRNGTPLIGKAEDIIEGQSDE